METLADRIHAGKTPARERFIDHSGQWSSGHIVRVQRAAVPERDTHRFEVARDSRHIDTHRDFRRRPLLESFRSGRPTSAFVRGQRKLTGECGCRDARHLAHRLEGLREVSMCGVGIPEPLSGRLHLHRQQVCRIESRRHGEQVLEAAYQQPRANEQHERQRDLYDDERTPRGMMPARDARVR